MKAVLITGLARVWNILYFVWSAIIVGFFVGLISNWLFTSLFTAHTDMWSLSSYTLLFWISNHFLLLISALLSLLLITFFAYLAKRQVYQKKARSSSSYNERMRELIKNLEETSKSADSILQEMARIIQEREKAIATLEGKQKQVQQYIESLQKGPAEPLKIFQEILEEQARQQDKEGRKLARRYFIYGSLITLLGTAIGVAFTLPSLIGK